MKYLFSKYALPAFLAAALAFALFSHSCANTTQAPTGGAKDTIPPMIVKVSPAPGALSVPVHGTQIVFTFDEYVIVKEPKGIYLSPPQEKSPKYRIRGKSVVVYFEEDLLPNTTYTLDLTGAIVDNNEGNFFPGYTAVFSTGTSIDSMMVTGTVQDCEDLKPIKGATVMLYKDHGDSAVFLQRPFASIKTDDWGFFCLRNLQDTLFRMYAVVDANGNNKYDPDEDRIAFLDTLFRPTTVVNDTLPELMKYEMKDTLNCKARRSEVELNVFRERPSKQLILNKARLADRAAYITFMAPDARIDSLWFRGIAANRVIAQFNIPKDSLELWVNDPRPMPDTLHLFVKYRKTDTLGVLSPATEEIRLVRENVAGSRSRRAARTQTTRTDTVLTVNLQVAPETFEQKGIAMEFQYPPVWGDFDALEFRSVNPRQQETEEKFKLVRDSLNLRRYLITPQVQILSGHEYIFKVPHRTFRDINGHWNDSTEVKVSLPTDENLSSLSVHVTGVTGKCVVDLLDEKRTKVLRSYSVSQDQTLSFPYLKQGKYSLRVTEDVNGNGIVDTGNLLQRRQPERVRFFSVDDKDILEIPERSEISQDLDITSLFE
ncbi:MAG: Ig-like domain-containing protein [Candidatus Cryptobacteroides sp.]|jgi:hypothetical protein